MISIPNIYYDPADTWSAGTITTTTSTDGSALPTTWIGPCGCCGITAIVIREPHRLCTWCMGSHGETEMSDEFKANLAELETDEERVRAVKVLRGLLCKSPGEPPPGYTTYAWRGAPIIPSPHLTTTASWWDNSSGSVRDTAPALAIRPGPVIHGSSGA